MCTATSDEEHAVSTARLGPRRSKTYESRFAATDCAVPVAACTSALSSRGICNCA